jgi:RNA recognition motif-containing protein
MTSLYVGNLSYALDEAGLKQAFVDMGITVKSARIVLDKDTRQPRGFGFVDVDDEWATEAIKIMDGAEVAGRPLRVAPATRSNSQR